MPYAAKCHLAGDEGGSQAPSPPRVETLSPDPTLIIHRSEAQIIRQCFLFSRWHVYNENMPSDAFVQVSLPGGGAPASIPRVGGGRNGGHS